MRARELRSARSGSTVVSAKSRAPTQPLGRGFDLRNVAVTPHGPAAEAQADRVAADAVATSRGRPLVDWFADRHGVDLSGVRVHTDDAATQARGARAFTRGNDVTVAAGELAAPRGRELLAHELTHVAQQRAAGTSTVQCAPKDGKAKGPDRAVDHRDVQMIFDGADLIVMADGAEVFRFGAQSGRPLIVRPQDLAKCGGDARTDSYMNNPRYTGVQDYGAIPEGTYTFSMADMQRFTLGEELFQIEFSHHTTTHKTAQGNVTGGDWGSGRVPLRPRHLERAPCGDASARSGFFLHGGWFSGSSGCIDIGTSFDTLADWLAGFPRPITVTVKYTQAPSPPGYLTGLSGMFAYEVFGDAPFNLSHGPHAGAGTEVAAPSGGPADTRFLLSTGYDGILRWAGGALAAGVRLDASIGSKEQFVRLGFEGSTNFRLFRSLYGTLQGGYLWPIGASATQTPGPFAGGGLGYDFGRVHLELLYDTLFQAKSQPAVHQALLSIGLTL